MTPANDPAIDKDTRDAVTDLLVRYATGIDSRDWELLRNCFTEDCEADYGEIGYWHGREQITTWMAATHDPLGPTLHRITNVSMAPDADLVRTRCYVHAIIVLPDRSAVHSYGHYEDEVVATSVGWRIARRRFTRLTNELQSPMG